MSVGAGNTFAQDDGDEIADEPPCVDDVVVGAGEVVKWGGEAEDGKVGHTEEPVCWIRAMMAWD